MNSLYHWLITLDALSLYFSEKALGELVLNNIRQDSIKNQLFHNEIHFDNNKISEGNQLISDYRSECIDAITSQNFPSARTHFGKLIHTAQDFYAHSNYARLYEKVVLSNKDLRSIEYDCLSSEINHSKEFKSHTIHFPGDYFCIIPLFARWFGMNLPEDSHTRMNLDSPISDGPFYLAYALAVNRTRIEHQIIITNTSLSLDQVIGFHNQ